MNGASARWSVRIVRWWTRVYTAGARSGVRDTRRAEIQSDLWEHAAHVDTVGMKAHELALEVAGRMVRGMPADLAWRLETGGLQMRSMFMIERSTGLVMLLVALLIVGAMSGPGISGGEPYFTDDFPRFASDLGTVFRTALFRFATGFALIPVSVLLYLTFRPHSKGAALFGAVALLMTGVLFIVGAAATLELHGLADDWRKAGAVPGDATWLEARDAASRVEALGLFTIVGLGVSFAGFGMVIARSAALPRPLAWPALAGGAALAASLPLWFFGDWAWFAFIVGLFSVAISFLLTAGWLTLRGTRKQVIPGKPA